MMLNSEIQKQIAVESATVRGEILTVFSSLEMSMELFISQYFCSSPDKQTEITEMILATKKFSFYGKYDTLMSILHKHHSDFLTTNKEFSLKKFADIAEKRNQVAHHAIDISDYGVELFKKNKTISFQKFHNSQINNDYSPKEIMELKKLILQINDKILTLAGN